MLLHLGTRLPGRDPRSARLLPSRNPVMPVIARRTAAVLCAGVLLAGCSQGPGSPAPVADTPTPARSIPTPARVTPSTTPPPRTAVPSTPAATTGPFVNLLPGMPPIVDGNVYGATRANMLAPQVARDPARLYVPDSTGKTVTVISQRTRRILGVLKAGQLSQHVSPSYDLRQLYVTSSAANELVAIDPRTGKKSRTFSVPRPYNLYFTPDGKQAVVMVEQNNAIRFVDPTRFRLIKQLTVPGCKGPNHADFSANGRFMLLTCEFSGALVKVSTLDHRVLGAMRLGSKSKPQDIRISPDGKVFFVADMGVNKVRIIDGNRLKQVGTISTPKHPHGLYPSRDSQLLYVSARGAGKISVISFATRKIVATWRIPGGGSPDMGGVSADGKMLWLSARYDGLVYGFDTKRGKLVATIKVGAAGPHGIAVWPQPGRYSLGHTGNLR